MKRVASVYLPEWAIDRLRRAGHVPRTQPDEAGVPTSHQVRASATIARADCLPGAPQAESLDQFAAGERARGCSVPNSPDARPGALWAKERDRAAALSSRHQGGNPGWRPGARWAKTQLADEIGGLPLHQRPSMREMGRRSEAAPHPFRAMRPDEAGQPRDRFPQQGMVPPPRTSGEGPRGAPYPGEGAFFLTGRMSGGIVGRACAREAGSSDEPRAARQLGHGEPPLVTAHRVDGCDLVHTANEAARICGIEPGMWLSQARVRVAELHILPADPRGDRVALERLAVALARNWAPTVALSGEDGLFVDLTGTSHLHGGEEGFCRRLGRLLARLGFHHRVAIADTPGAAWAFTRHLPSHPAVICPSGCHVEGLEPLPVAALRLENKHLELLRRLGVDTVGELAHLPRGPLAKRFGGALVRRLDQAFGRAPEPLQPVQVPERIEVARRFFEPIASAEVIEHQLDKLAPELGQALARAGVGARLLLLVAERVDGRTQTLRVGLARPNRDAAHLLRLLRRQIEKIDPGFGIDALRLVALRTEPLGPQTLGPELAEQGAPDLGQLVDLLANRIGEGRVWRVRAVECDVPERSVLPCPPLDPPDRAAPELRENDVRRLKAAEDDHCWHPRWPRPVRLLSRPEPVEHVLAELPDQPPKRFTWRGESYSIVRADGPERITGEWWRRSAERDAVRDYFNVEDETGRRFWIFRRGDGVRGETGDLSWHLHGTFG